VASRDVKKPLWGLHPGHTRIAEIPQGMLQNGRKRARIGIADDNKIAVGLLHSVAQIPGLKADVAGAGDVLDSFLVGYLLHGSPFAIVEHVDLQINRVRIGDLLGVSDTQADQLWLLVVGRKEYIDTQGAGRHLVGLADGVVDQAWRGLLRCILDLPEVDRKQDQPEVAAGLRNDQRDSKP